MSLNTTRLARYQTEQLDRLRRHLREAMATGDIEAVHGLRVASRRLHDALALAATTPGRKRVSSAQRLLKRIRKAYRRTRDLDVLRLSLNDPAVEPPLDPEALAAIDVVLTHRRERAVAAAARIARRQKVSKGLAAVEKLIAALARLTEAKPAVVEERLAAILRQRAAALLAADPREDTADLHETRIRVKQVRYCVQLLEVCGCLEASGLTAELTRMQTLLGQWNDRIVFAGTLSRFAGRRRTLTARAGISATLLQHTAVQAQAIVQDRKQIVDEWSALTALITETISGLTDGETPEAESVPPPCQAEPAEGNG